MSPFSFDSVVRNLQAVNFGNPIECEKDDYDRDRTRTCNPQIRSLMPYPLGHTATFDDEDTVAQIIISTGIT